MSLVRRDIGDVEALITDRYLDALLAVRPDAGAPLEDADRSVGEAVRAVNLVVNVPDGAAAAKAGELLADQLRGYGFTIDANAPVTLHLSATVGSRDYQTNLQETVSVPRVEGEIALFGPGREEAWSYAVQGEAGPLLSDRVRAATDQQATAWNLFLQSVANTPLPRMIVIADDFRPRRSSVPFDESRIEITLESRAFSP